MSELAAHVSALEGERAAAATTISSLRQELADRQLALSASHDAANEAVQRVEQLSKEIRDMREAAQVNCQGCHLQHYMYLRLEGFAACMQCKFDNAAPLDQATSG